MKKSKFKEIIKKIDIHHIVIAIVLLALFLCVFYTYSSSKLTKFKQEVIETKNLDYNNYEINKTKEDSYSIHCFLKKSELEKEEFFNYVSGKGEGYKINYTILVKLNNEYYKAKTIKTGEDNDFIELSAFIRDKKIDEKSNISLYNVNNKTILEYKENNDEQNKKNK